MVKHIVVFFIVFFIYRVSEQSGLEGVLIIAFLFFAYPKCFATPDGNKL